MKKIKLPVILILILTLVLAVFITGCSEKAPEETVSPTPEPTPEPEVFAPNFDSTESAKMGAYMYDGRYLITDEYVYYGFVDRVYWEKCVAVAADQTITRISSSDSEYKEAEITEFPCAMYMTQSADGTIYFLSENGEVCKTTPGSESAEVVFNPEASTLQIDNEKLWYTKSGENDGDELYRSDLDGKNEEKILDKAVYYPYAIGNFVLYQDDADGESLHLYNIESKEDKKLYDGHIHSPNIVGNWIFCLEQDQETGFARVIGLEFDENGEFTSRAFDRDNEFWYANAGGMHSVIIRANSDDAMMFLSFKGNHVENYGEADQYIDEDSDFQGSAAPWLAYDPYYDVNPDWHFCYSSPYGYLKVTDEKTADLNLHDKVCQFDGLYAEGTPTEEQVQKWLESGK